MDSISGRKLHPMSNSGLLVGSLCVGASVAMQQPAASNQSTLLTPKLVADSDQPALAAGKRAHLVCSGSGFSLIELLIVLSVAMIAATITILNMRTAVRGVRLHESGIDYANLLQQARVRAIQDDKYYTILTATDPASGTPFAFVDIAGTGFFAAREPRMIFASGVTPMPFASGPARANLMSQFLPAGTSGTVNAAAAGPTFGPRGLPCTPVTSGGYTTCPYLTPTSFITFLQNQQGGAWEAITVTPAGRVRQWDYNGATWSPLN
jgi:type II secretory pathway pseudopilin PulG